MQKKKIPLYAIRIAVDGDMKRMPIEMDKKWPTIQSALGTRATEQHYAGEHNGVRRIAICDRYGSVSNKRVNTVASRLCGTKLYGVVLLFKENADGFPVLMSDAAAYMMQREVERLIW